MADDNSYTVPKPSSNAHGKIWEVIKASRRNFEGIIGQGREMKFGKQGAFTTTDPKLAKDINNRYGYGKGGTRDVVVVERDAYAATSRRNVWSVPEMPWKRDAEDTD